MISDEALKKAAAKAAEALFHTISEMTEPLHTDTIIPSFSQNHEETKEQPIAKKESLES